MGGKALAEWEAKHRTESEAAAGRVRDDQGRFIQACVSHTAGKPEDKQSTRGIRRRLQKRVKAGDATSQSRATAMATGTRAQPLAAAEIGVEGGKPGPGRGNKTDSDATRFNDRGQTYLLRRIARDQPQLLDQIDTHPDTAAVAIQ